MADIAKFQTPSLATMSPSYESQHTTIVNETNGIAAGDAMYIDSTSQWKLCTPTSAGGATATGAKAYFFAASDGKKGEALTGFEGVIFHYGSQLTPGSLVYLADNTGGTKAGQLATTPPYTNASPVGYCIDTQRIFLKANWQQAL